MWNNGYQVIIECFQLNIMQLNNLLVIIHNNLKKQKNIFLAKIRTQKQQKLTNNAVWWTNFSFTDKLIDALKL